MRLFTAIDIPPFVRENLKALLDRLRPSAKLRWSPVENLHITTKFIGEWPDNRRSELEQTFARVPRPPAIDIAIRDLGWFPNAQNPRVFWAGVDGGEPLKTLARETDEALAAIGVGREDREFSPHLTLARTAHRRSREKLPKESLAAVRRAVAAVENTDFGEFRACSHALYRSAGGKYTILYEVSFYEVSSPS